MKRKLFASLLACAIVLTTCTGCNIENDKFSSVLYEHTNWYDDISPYCYNVTEGQTTYKKIDRSHKEAFDSALNNIEILGARLCLPMKVSELPDKFELSASNSEFIPLSEDGSRYTESDNGMREYSLELYYDREISVANVRLVCEKDQSIDEGIICEIDYGVFDIQTIMLGGKLDPRESGIDEITELLGEGNTFYHDELLSRIYTDGNRVIELVYDVRDNDEPRFLTGYFRLLGY